MSSKLICIGGLPGVGKTEVARKLTQMFQNSVMLDPDKIRLEILGKNPEIDRLHDKDITQESTIQTIAQMKYKTIEALKQGQTVIIGSAFVSESMRIEYEAVAHECNAVFKAVWLNVSEDIRHARAQKRLMETNNPSAVSAATDLEIEGALIWPVVDASGTLNDVVSAVELSLRG
jgi:predicted kinase